MNLTEPIQQEKGRIRDQQSQQELKIKEKDSHIDSEVSSIKTQMETIRNFVY